MFVREPNPDPLAYPRTRSSESAPLRQFQPSWVKQYPWAHYSAYCDGVFCQACAFFAPTTIGGNILGQFVTKPFKSWGSKSQKFSNHASLDYHLTACTKMNEFIVQHRSPSSAINVRLDNEAKKQMEANKQVIESLLKVVMLLGKQGLPFRGHRDDKIDWVDTDSEENPGNLVHFRAETDAVLNDHLKEAPKNAKYTSKAIQNELINIIGDHIRSKILSEVEAAQFYSLIADELTDISNKEQLSISFHYIFNGNVKEVFLDFVEVAWQNTCRYDYSHTH